MSAELIPFPQVRRSRLIRSLASQMVEKSDRFAELILSKEMERQFNSLLKKGISSEVADRECYALELEVRARVRARLSLNGGAA